MTALIRVLKGLPTKKLIASVTLFCFLFISIVPHVLAAPRFSSDEPVRVGQVKPQQVSPVEATQTSDKVRVTLPGGETEEGRVLFCVPFVNCDVVGNIADAIASAMKWILEQLLGLVPGVAGLFEIFFIMVAKVVLYIVHLIAMVLGSDAGAEGNAVCEDITDPTQQSECQNLVLQIQQVDPLFKPEVANFARKYNIFVVADSTFAGLYESFPDTNPVQYLAYEFQDNILGIKTVQAQGAGTESIGGILRSIWVKMRDITYIAMVIVLIVVGFMIMFRKKLDPRTAVTAANSLPRIVIGLILITFSFAISGLFIDFIYISVNLVRAYLGGIGGLAPAFSWLANNFPGGEFAWLPFFTLVSASVLNWPAVMAMFLATVGVAALFGVGGFILIIIGLLGALAIDIFIRLIMFILAILLFWALLKRFVMILLLTVFSPFFFLLGSVPGFEGVIVNWFKRMLASALAFPAILVIVYIAVALLSSNYPILGVFPVIPSGGGPTPPPPLEGAGFFLNLTALTGLGVLFFASRIPDFIDDMLGLRGPAGRGGFGPGAVVGGASGGLQTMGNLRRARQFVQESGLGHRLMVVGAARYTEGEDKGKIVPGTGRPTPFGRAVRGIGGLRGAAVRGATRFGSFVRRTPPPPSPPREGGPKEPGATQPGGEGERPGSVV